MKLVIIGSGNVAWHFAKVSLEKGHDVLQLVNLHRKNFSTDFDAFSVPYIYAADQIRSDADIYIIAIKDSALETVTLPSLSTAQIVVHSSGISNIDLLSSFAVNYGCLYPLQTLTKGVDTSFEELPLLIEASNDETMQVIRQFAKSLSHTVIAMSLEQRQIVHANAVIVNNFTNHLLHLSNEFLKNHQIDFNLFLPLINETIHKLKTSSPFENQTGPARRGDMKTIAAHKKILQEDATLLHIYEVITSSIIKHYQSDEH